MTKELSDLFDELAAARRSNIEVFARMAELTDAAAVGFKPRDPDGLDVTLEIMRRAADEHPVEFATALAKVMSNDERVARIAGSILYELYKVFK